MYEIIRCPKCEYTQKAGPVCLSCGLALGRNGSQATAVPTASNPGPSRTAMDPTVQRKSEQPPAGSSAQSAPTGDLSFHGSGASLFGIHIVNIFLSLLTFGVYFFWGKTRVRSYLFSQSEFAGDRFAYHGTGRELFIGFLKAAVIFGVISALFRAAPLFPGGIAVKVTAFLLGYGLLLTFIPLAMVGSRRYRLSRSSWRGIRFSFRGKLSEFIKLFVRGGFLSGLTFGIYYPFFITKQYAFMTNGAYFGNRKFSFDGNGKDIFGFYLRAFGILMIWSVTMGFALPLIIATAANTGQAPFGSKTAAIAGIGGIAIFTGAIFFGLKTFLTAKRQKYFWDHTTIESARFSSTIEFLPLLSLTLTNFFILIFTLGFGWSWTAARKARYYMSNLSLEGAIDLQAIQQEAQSASPVGEALDGFLDVDVGFGPA
jgi:uncharacterized membrane protein YjgN (DUF898 family)